MKTAIVIASCWATLAAAPAFAQLPGTEGNVHNAPTSGTTTRHYYGNHQSTRTYTKRGATHNVNNASARPQRPSLIRTPKQTDFHSSGDEYWGTHKAGQTWDPQKDTLNGERKVYVEGYRRKDGTYVAPVKRNLPNNGGKPAGMEGY